jgi:preprotein translocase subunit SecF
MTDNAPSGQDPTPDELREQARATRDELAHTVEALAAKTDVKAQAQQKAAETRTQAQQKAAQAKHQVQDTTAHVLQTARDKTPEPVREKATHAATAANEHRGLVLAALAAAVVAVLLCRKRGGR